MTLPTHQGVTGSPVALNELLEDLKGRPPAVTRVARFAFEKYASKIDCQDLRSFSASKQVECVTSRCLAAFAIESLAGATENEAAESIVDGGQDLGLDAIFLNRMSKQCWVVQSKLVKKGDGEIAQSDIDKMLRGFDHITGNTVREGQPNPKILALADDLREAATSIGWKFKLVLASTSKNAISEEKFGQIAKEIGADEIANQGAQAFINFGLNEITEAATRSSQSPQEDLHVRVLKCGEIDDPIIAYYGRVTLADVLGWQKHGRALFEANIRSYLGDTEISESLAGTLAKNSELFWYLNNGITIIADSIGVGGPFSRSTRNDERHLQCKGASIVNGAQTVGTIWERCGAGELLDPRACVQVKLISLEGAGSQFGKSVTVATNTQQKILPQNFAANDPVQATIAAEFRLDNREYVFKDGDPTPSESKGCTLEELAVALACEDSPRLATIAYRNKGFLTDPRERQYKEIFHEKTIDTRRAFIRVRILRESDKILQSLRKSENGRRSQVASYGSRAVQHVVFKSSKVREASANPDNIEDNRLSAAIDESTRTAFAKVCDLVDSGRWGKHIANIFKNQTSVGEILGEALAVKHNYAPGSSLPLFQGSEEPTHS